MPCDLDFRGGSGDTHSITNLSVRHMIGRGLPEFGTSACSFFCRRSLCDPFFRSTGNIPPVSRVCAVLFRGFALRRLSKVFRGWPPRPPFNGEMRSSLRPHTGVDCRRLVACRSRVRPQLPFNHADVYPPNPTRFPCQLFPFLHPLPYILRPPPKRLFLGVWTRIAVIGFSPIRARRSTGADHPSVPAVTLLLLCPVAFLPSVLQTSTRRVILLRWVLASQWTQLHSTR